MHIFSIYLAIKPFCLIAKAGQSSGRAVRGGRPVCRAPRVGRRAHPALAGSSAAEGASLPADTAGTSSTANTTVSPLSSAKGGWQAATESSYPSKLDSMYKR